MPRRLGRRKKKRGTYEPPTVSPNGADEVDPSVPKNKRSRRADGGQYNPMKLDFWKSGVVSDPTVRGAMIVAFCAGASLSMQVRFSTREQGFVPHSQETASAGPLEENTTSLDGDATVTLESEEMAANDDDEVVNWTIPTPATNGMAQQQYTLNSNDGSRAFIQRQRSDFFGLRNKNAARSAKHRSVKSIVDAIKNAGTNNEQIRSALSSALKHREIHAISTELGLLRSAADQTSHNELLYCFEQIRAILKVTKGTATSRGRACNVRDLFSGTVLTAMVAGSKTEMRDHRRPGYHRLSKILDQPFMTIVRLARRAEKKRVMLLQQNINVWNRLVTKQKGSSKIVALVPQIVDWVRTHPNVVPSLQMRDTLIINGERVGKLLLEIPVRELHNSIIKPAEEGGLPCVRDASNRVLVSDTSFCSILKKHIPELRKATDAHRQMCGCEICVISTLMFKSIEAWRCKYVLKLNANAQTQQETTTANEYRHFVAASPTKPSEGIKHLMCLPVENCDNQYKWRCVLRRCNNCPQYQTNEHENGVDNSAPTINFNFYVSYHKCSEHRLLPIGTKLCNQCNLLPQGAKVGKVSSSKKLEVFTKPIGIFMRDYYLPMLEKCAYHLPHVVMLSGKFCGGMRRDAMMLEPYSFNTSHDYSERLTPECDMEIQSDHFNHDTSLSMEGYGVTVFDQSKILQIENGSLDVEQLHEHVQREYHSFFSEDSKQDAVTTHSNMTNLFNQLVRRGTIKRTKSICRDSTDGCAKQYRCATALYMLSVLALHFGIVIDRAIGAPGHGKSEIDGLMAVDKTYLRSFFRRIVIPESREGDNRFIAATVKDGNEFSLATKCVEACKKACRVNGMISDKKYNKREESKVIKKRFYHESRRDDVKCKDLKCSITGGFAKGCRNGLSAMYNIRADPELPLGTVAVRRIPCACSGCCDKLKRPIRERYTGDCTDCKYRDVFEDTNDWHLVTVAPRSDCRDEDIDEAKLIVLDSMKEITASEINIGNVGAFSTQDPTYEGFYLVEWTSLPFASPNDQSLMDYDPPMFVKQGEMLVTAKYLDTVPRAKNWWCPIDQTVTVRVQQILASECCLIDHSEQNPLPHTCNRNEAIQLNAKKLCENDRDKILNQILIRSLLDFDEQQDCADDISLSDDESKTDSYDGRHEDEYEKDE